MSYSKKNKVNTYAEVRKKLEENELILEKLRKKQREQSEIQNPKERLSVFSVEDAHRLSRLIIGMEFQKYVVKWKMDLVDIETELIESVMTEIEQAKEDNNIGKEKELRRIFDETEMLFDLIALDKFENSSFIPSINLVQLFEKFDTEKSNENEQTKNITLQDYILKIEQDDNPDKMAFKHLSDHVLWILANNIDIFTNIPVTGLIFLDYWYDLKESERGNVLECLMKLMKGKMKGKVKLFIKFKIKKFEWNLDINSEKNIMDSIYSTYAECVCFLAKTKKLELFWKGRKEERDYIISIWEKIALNCKNDILDVRALNFFLHFEDSRRKRKDSLWSFDLTREEQDIISFVQDIGLYFSFLQENELKKNK